MASSSEANEISQAAKDFTVLAKELQENLAKACAKNEALLEAIESSEAKSTEPSSEAPFLRNMRARLAAAHAPNAALRRELSKFMGIFDKRFKELDQTVKEYDRLVLALKVEKRNLEEQNTNLQRRKVEHEREREEWKQKLEEARTEIQDQNDRLAVLADQLTGAKVALDSQTRELASRRLAFEEEKLSREEEEFRASDTEAEELRQRLRQQILKNSELEDKLLRTELALHQKGEIIATVNSSKERLQRDLMQSRQSSTRAVKQFDLRTNDANRRLAEMNVELIKAQEHAKRFQEVLAVERRKQKALRHALEQEMKRNSEVLSETFSPQAQKAYLDTLADSLSVPNKPRNPLRVDDVVRKNEQLTVENASLKAEIHRVRLENSDLVKKVAQARANDEYMRNQASTNMADRLALQKRLAKSETQYRELQTSLTRQASDWVADKQKQQKVVKDQMWRKIEPIDLFGGSERLRSTLPRTSSKQITQ
jgi:hypothetical protein